MRRYAAFISYSSHYRDWVGSLHRNLEQCLSLHGESRSIFLDQTDLGPGQSWVAQLQAGLDAADQLILVITPEALASPRVADEWEAFVVKHPDWTGRLQVVMLVEAPLLPFLGRIQYVDFQARGRTAYAEALQVLLSGLLGHKDRRASPALAEEIEIPDTLLGHLPKDLRRRLVAWLAPVLENKLSRVAVCSTLGFQPALVEGHPSSECAASAALVKATGDDDRVAAARRIVKSLAELFEGDPDRLEELSALESELAKSGGAPGQAGLLGLWLERVEQDHSELLPFFEARKDLPLLDEVYVQLELRDERPRHRPDKAAPGTRSLERHLTLPRILELTSREVEDLTGRWVVLGDPGAGKTTLLRHLAASLAREASDKRVPVFDSLPRLMRQREWLFERIERQLAKGGHRARGLGAVLEQAGRDGRLVLLLDGLDEVPREERVDAESLLRDLSGRWPETPIVISSRPIGYRRPAHDFRELEVQPFDRQRRREFLRRWFGRGGAGRSAEARADSAARAFEKDSALRDLAGNPLYLTLMALLIEKGTSPGRHRTGLYDQVFQLLLDGAHRPNPEPIEAQDAVRQVLRHLAYEMTRDNRDAEPVAKLEARLYQPEADALREPLERVPRWRRSLRPFLDDLAERTGILGPHDGPGADWRYWHRTFREALAAEALEARLERQEGKGPVLSEAGSIATEDDLSRWAEPYALLAGRVEDPDELVRALVKENRPLGLRALATAQGLKDETVGEILELSEDASERAGVYERLPELIEEPERALALVERLIRGTRNGHDLYFLERAARAVAEKWPVAERGAEHLLSRLWEHIPAPPEELFRWIETGDGRQDLWCEIPAGSFRMGSPEDEEGRDGDEGPQHEVRILSGFRMAAVPVTVAQYAAFDPDHRSYHQDEVPEERIGAHPVEQVSWFEAVAFCRWLSNQLPEGQGARLPTEEEWEYACRAGTETRYFKGDQESDLAKVGWYDANSESRTHRVGRKPPNSWGLYDVHGNVDEWTLSEWSDDYSGREGGVEVDPPKVEAPASTSGDRVCRGGSCLNVAGVARSAYRNRDDPDWTRRLQGFRVLLPASRGSRA